VQRGTLIAGAGAGDPQIVELSSAVVLFGELLIRAGVTDVDSVLFAFF
jgi:hypothetical protein